MKQNKISWTDTHAHISISPLIENIETIIQNAKEAHVNKICNICCDKKALIEGLKISKAHSNVFLIAAPSPHDVEKDYSSFKSLIEKCAREKKLIAIGETGLDYHYFHASKEKQKEALILFCQIAKKYSLPLIIHCRDAFTDLFNILDKHFSKGKVLLHCFTGTQEEANQALFRGWYISFSGIVTFKKSSLLQEVLSNMPLDRLLIETDSPYLAPEGKRGNVNEPANVPIIGKYVATKKIFQKRLFQEFWKRISINSFLYFNIIKTLFVSIR